MFITFEGGEGSGKSTQITLLAERLHATGHLVIKTREPGGCWLAEQIRGLLVQEHRRLVVPEAELLLFAAARMAHLHEVIRPALARGAWVLCDRFHDSTTAYQGYGRGVDLARIAEVHRWVLGDTKPAMTILLDLEPEIGLTRSRSRETIEKRFENETLTFHRRVREGFHHLAIQEPARFRLIPADGTVEDVHQRIWQVVSDVGTAL